MTFFLKSINSLLVVKKHLLQFFCQTLAASTTYWDQTNLACNVSFNMSYSLVLWVKIWQIFTPSRLELLKTHHYALGRQWSFALTGKPVWSYGAGEIQKPYNLGRVSFYQFCVSQSLVESIIVFTYTVIKYFNKISQFSNKNVCIILTGL